MTLPSGIVLPGEKPLTLHEVAAGLYVVDNAYEYDAGFFGESPLYSKEELEPAPGPRSETVKPSASSVG